MTPCQKKLDCASVVAPPGNSQSISSLMSLIVMNAVTTPPHLPVFTRDNVSIRFRDENDEIRVMQGVLGDGAYLQFAVTVP